MKKPQIFAITAVVAIALIATCVVVNENSDSLFPTTPTIDTQVLDQGTLEVIFLDVGQADSILLKTGTHTMLIDAGNIGQDQLMLNYLSTYEVTSLDYLVATHPHADHIGAMTAVVNKMDNIDTIIMPDKTHTIQAYKNLITAIDAKDITVNIAEPGQNFTMGNANIQVIAPNYIYSDLNECSVVLRVEFGETVFLFTGDADTKSENDQITNGLSLDADVLKVGHHGSRTSSSKNYLDIVTPTYAVISCGAGNTYNHPHQEAMTRLIATGATIYRTDENGTIIFTTDGKTITVTVEKDTPTPTEEGTIYIGNKNSKIFHLPTCHSLPIETNRIYFNSRQEAIDAGYTPCGTCKP
ncbi:MAG: MBL fold metallo-hydrolase [Candidatus Bathyarchaeota archaeon]|nr:MBL fold metallo-hydrolase [Candidatus Termiticorpusculum sp.]